MFGQRYETVAYLYLPGTQRPDLQMLPIYVSDIPGFLLLYLPVIVQYPNEIIPLSSVKYSLQAVGTDEVWHVKLLADIHAFDVDVAEDISVVKHVTAATG